MRDATSQWNHPSGLPTLSTIGYWSSSIRRPSFRLFQNGCVSLCIPATAHMSAKENDMTRIQHWDSLHPETRVTCLPIFHSVFPFTMHLSQQRLEEIIFHIGCTCLFLLPLNIPRRCIKMQWSLYFPVNNLGKRKANCLALRNRTHTQQNNTEKSLACTRGEISSKCHCVLAASGETKNIILKVTDTK